MTRAERKRFAKWCGDHDVLVGIYLVWLLTGGWMVPLALGSEVSVLAGWLSLPVCLLIFLPLMALNSGVAHLRARRGGRVAYEYSLERVEDREKAVQRREDAVRELEARTRHA